MSADIGREIIELDALPDADRIAAISSRVERARHVLESINAVSADLTSAQLAAVARLPFVRRIWSNGPVPGQVNQSAQQIGAREIRDMGIGGSGVRVAVVDNGLQDDHPEYDGRVVAERFNVDDGGHATHVAGIIAADDMFQGVAPGAMLADAVINQRFAGRPPKPTAVSLSLFGPFYLLRNAQSINT